LRAAFAECRRVAFDAVADKYGFTEAMRATGLQVFRQTEVTEPMYGYGDLAVLKELLVQRFLVTSGFRRLQESKVRALGFADWFAAIYIDALDEPNRRGKHGFFQDILSAHDLRPDEVLVGGDNPDSEIEAGNQLGDENDSGSSARRAAERSRDTPHSRLDAVERTLVCQRCVRRRPPPRRKARWTTETARHRLSR
jgi:FMN phosphatase YigB (HAD superfamily)